MKRWETLFNLHKSYNQIDVQKGARADGADNI